MEEFKEYILKSKNLDEIYDIRWKLHLGEKIKKKHTENLNIALVNVPCGGYGDVIKCIKIFTYLKKWYRNANISILSASKQKFRNLGIDEPIIDIKHKIYKDSHECNKFKDLKLSNNKKFDFYLIIPTIADPFDINDFKKMVPHANKWNTFTMSEYNDIDTKPNDFPIGIGKGNLGLFFDRSVSIKQTMVKNPYALVYIQSREDNILHSRYCFLSFLEMIIKKNEYKSFKTFEIVLPNWICDDILNYYPVKNKCLKLLRKRYNEIHLVTKNDSIELYNDNKKIHKTKKNKTRPIYKKIIFRGDILPQPREKFIGLIKDSVNDILLTGDESLVDSLNCCIEKTIWYQIAPWKKNLADNLYEVTGNKNYKSYKTSCGNIKGYKFKNDINKLIKENDFRILGKERFDSVLIGFYENNNNKEIKEIIKLIEHSRYLHTIKNKIKNM